VEQLVDRRSPIASFFPAPTIATQAKMLRREDWAPAGSSLVPLQPIQQGAHVAGLGRVDTHTTAALPYHWPAHFLLPYLRSRIAVHCHGWRSLSWRERADRYIPKPYPGDVHLITLKETPEYHHAFWSGLLRGRVFRHRIEGEHLSVILNPVDRSQLVEALRTALTTAPDDHRD